MRKPNMEKFPTWLKMNFYSRRPQLINFINTLSKAQFLAELFIYWEVGLDFVHYFTNSSIWEV